MTDVPYAQFYKGAEIAMFETVEGVVSEHRHQ
jgi:hypothetical protein